MSVAMFLLADFSQEFYKPFFYLCVIAGVIAAFLDALRNK